MIKYGESVQVDTNLQLLACYTDLVNRYGDDSNEAKEFLDQYKDNKEFLRLVKTGSKI